LLGRPESVVTIHGGMGREERARAQGAFTQDKDVQVLIATDAAGEGINLQRAHLMVNYDLPWNPNRLEQRFGRIHRIGQTEVCHLWNLVAAETREGEVYHRLLEKLDEERAALGGQVFDVLGKVTFANRPLRELLLEAIRYGDQPEVRARLTYVVDAALDRARLRELLEERALAHDAMDVAQVRRIREDMERAETRRLQPHFIAAFFLEAFRLLGGSVREREPKRYEITHVPAVIRNRDRQVGTREPIVPRYERITFEKALISLPGKPVAAFICPGHALLDATIDVVLERYRDLLKRGAVLIDGQDPSETPRAMFYVEHAVQDARIDRGGQRHIVSRQLQFVEIDAAGAAHTAGYAPYLDYRPPSAEERALLAPFLAPSPPLSHAGRGGEGAWLQRDLEAEAASYAIERLVPEHFAEVSGRKEELVAKTLAAVQERLTKEILYWDRRAEELRAQELAGKTPRLNSARARARADELQGRLTKRTEELEQERRLAPLPPVVIGGALIVPGGLLARLLGSRAAEPAAFARETKRVEALAMAAVMAAERRLDYDPRDVSAAKCGYDIESRIPGSGRLRFLEVKGRIQGAETVTITKNEILTALNKPDDWVLALVEVPPAEFGPGDAFATGIAEEHGAYLTGEGCIVRYVRQPFAHEPDFGAVSVNYKWDDLWVRAEEPA
jgi:hypothetical protein